MGTAKRAWSTKSSERGTSHRMSALESLKQKMRRSVDKDEEVEKPEYDVSQYYHEEGKARWIATHDNFQNGTLFVISFNAVWMAVDTDWSKAETLTEKEWPFQMMEHLFCVYFTFEWLVRFCAFKHKCDGRKDAWFVFDSTLVALMVM